MNVCVRPLPPSQPLENCLQSQQLDVIPENECPERFVRKEDAFISLPRADGRLIFRALIAVHPFYLFCVFRREMSDSER